MAKHDKPARAAERPARGSNGVQDRAAGAGKPAKRQGAKKGGPDPIDVHVGGRVRLRRMIMGMSQDALGKALGLTFQQIQKYEKGANRIGAGRLKQLSELLEVPVQFFYDDYDDIIGAPARGFAEDPEQDEFMEFVRSPEGVKLCRYYAQISDPEVRKRVLELVRSISGTEDAA